jgi:hypothetical protein
MLAQTFDCDTAPGIDYTITRSKQGWQLTVWEAAVTEEDMNPFLWKFRVELPTLNEAQSTLQSILGERSVEGRDSTNSEPLAGTNLVPVSRD